MAPAAVRGFVFVDAETSRYEPGLFAIAELALEVDGEPRRAQLEIDARRATGEDVLVTYAERAGSTQVFLSTQARGVVALPEVVHGDCGCLDVAFDLELVDAGQDGEPGTEDDRARRLRRGLYGWGGPDQRCGGGRLEGALPEGAVVLA
ncbi:MAG: hypothetical protein IT378_04715, partial [Sandaracinaceae bacterium]|nr:hypothetical protein [Sandaracinaceae bacterium]